MSTHFERLHELVKYKIHKRANDDFLYELIFLNLTVEIMSFTSNSLTDLTNSVLADVYPSESLSNYFAGLYDIKRWRICFGEGAVDLVEEIVSKPEKVNHHIHRCNVVMKNFDVIFMRVKMIYPSLRDRYGNNKRIDKNDIIAAYLRLLSFRPLDDDKKQPQNDLMMGYFLAMMKRMLSSFPALEYLKPEFLQLVNVVEKYNVTKGKYWQLFSPEKMVDIFFLSNNSCVILPKDLLKIIFNYLSCMEEKETINALLTFPEFQKNTF